MEHLVEPKLTGAEFEIGGRLRTWRRDKGLSLTQVAEASGLSIGYISQVERGMANPSLGTLKRLADVVSHRVGELFAEDSTSSNNTRYTISRRGERKKIHYPGSGIVNELLSPDLQHRMEVIWLEAPIGASSGGHPHSHEGEECGVVLAGKMLFWIGNDEIGLEAGDSIYLDSTFPHRWKAAGVEDLRALWLISPPTF